MRDVFVYGAGGYAKVVIDALAAGGAPYRAAMVVDDDPARHGSTLRDLPIRPPGAIGEEPGFIAIGSNEARRAAAARFRGRLITIVHPKAVVSGGVTIGEGSIVMAGAIVSSDVRIGENVIINSGTVIGHDCVVEDGVHVGPGSLLCGNVRVGENAFLGTATVVTPGVKIGRGVFVHACGRVTRDLADGVTHRYAA